MDLLYRFLARFFIGDDFLILSTSSHSRHLPMSSVAFLVLRPPRAPPPEPPSPLTPPEPPDPPDPRIYSSFGESLVQPLNLTSFRASDSLNILLSSAIPSFCRRRSPFSFRPLMLPIEPPFASWVALTLPPPIFPQALFPPPYGFSKDFITKEVCFTGCSWFDASLAELHLIFPKFPLVWRGLDARDSSVSQGSSSRLMVPSTYVVEFVILWVIMDAIYQETVEIVLVCWSLTFSFYDLYLVYPLFYYFLMVFFGICCLHFFCFGCTFSSIRG